MAAAVEDTFELLGGSALVGTPRTGLEVHALIEQGLPYESLACLAEAVGMTPQDLGAEVLHISRRTLTRRRGRGRLPADESDRLYRLARIVAHAVDVFEDTQRASAWLKRPNVTLGGSPPMDLLATDAGAREVDDVLGRIEFGMAA
ncbi:MAG: type II RES/Xre toxin-antitoxin system antitoxin [Myxococcota bacterium]